MIMTREEMLIRFEDGEHPLLITLDKWKRQKTLDDTKGARNCALCEKFNPYSNEYLHDEEEEDCSKCYFFQNFDKNCVEVKRECKNLKEYIEVIESMCEQEIVGF